MEENYSLNPNFYLKLYLNKDIDLETVISYFEYVNTEFINSINNFKGDIKEIIFFYQQWFENILNDLEENNQMKNEFYAYFLNKYILNSFLNIFNCISSYFDFEWLLKFKDLIGHLIKFLIQFLSKKNEYKNIIIYILNIIFDDNFSFNKIENKNNNNFIEYLDFNYGINNLKFKDLVIDQEIGLIKKNNNKIWTIGKVVLIQNNYIKVKCVSKKDDIMIIQSNNICKKELIEEDISWRENWQKDDLIYYYDIDCWELIKIESINIINDIKTVKILIRDYEKFVKVYSTKILNPNKTNLESNILVNPDDLLYNINFNYNNTFPKIINNNSFLVYNFEFINKFIELEGFDIISDIIENIDFENFMNIVNLIYYISNYLNYNGRVKIIKFNFIEIIKKRIIEELTINLRSFDNENLINLISKVESIGKNIYSKFNNGKFILDLGDFLFHTKILEKQNLGIKFITNWISSCNYNSDLVKTYFINNNFFDKIINSHEFIVEQSKIIFVFYIKNNIINFDEINILLDILFTTDNSSSKKIFTDVINYCLYHFNYNHFLYIISYIKKNIEIYNRTYRIEITEFLNKFNILSHSNDMNNKRESVYREIINLLWDNFYKNDINYDKSTHKIFLDIVKYGLNKVIKLTIEFIEDKILTSFSTNPLFKIKIIKYFIKNSKDNEKLEINNKILYLIFSTLHSDITIEKSILTKYFQIINNITDITNINEIFNKELFEVFMKKSKIENSLYIEWLLDNFNKFKLILGLDKLIEFFENLTSFELNSLNYNFSFDGFNSLIYEIFFQINIKNNNIKFIENNLVCSQTNNIIKYDSLVIDISSIENLVGLSKIWKFFILNPKNISKKIDKLKLLNLYFHNEYLEDYDQIQILKSENYFSYLNDLFIPEYLDNSFIKSNLTSLLEESIKNIFKKGSTDLFIVEKFYYFKTKEININNNNFNNSIFVTDNMNFYELKVLISKLIKLNPEFMVFENNFKFKFEMNHNNKILRNETVLSFDNINIIPFYYKIKIENSLKNNGNLSDNCFLILNEIFYNFQGDDVLNNKNLFYLINILVVNNNDNNINLLILENNIKENFDFDLNNINLEEFIKIFKFLIIQYPYIFERNLKILGYERNLKKIPNSYEEYKIKNHYILNKYNNIIEYINNSKFYMNCSNSLKFQLPPQKSVLVEIVFLNKEYVATLNLEELEYYIFILNYLIVNNLNKHKDELINYYNFENFDQINENWFFNFINSRLFNLLLGFNEYKEEKIYLFYNVLYDILFKFLICLLENKNSINSIFELKNNSTNSEKFFLDKELTHIKMYISKLNKTEVFNSFDYQQYFIFFKSFMKIIATKENLKENEIELFFKLISIYFMLLKNNMIIEFELIEIIIEFYFFKYEFENFNEVTSIIKNFLFGLFKNDLNNNLIKTILSYFIKKFYDSSIIYNKTIFKMFKGFINISSNMTNLQELLNFKNLVNGTIQNILNIFSNNNDNFNLYTKIKVINILISNNINLLEDINFSLEIPYKWYFILIDGLNNNTFINSYVIKEFYKLMNLIIKYNPKSCDKLFFDIFQSFKINIPTIDYNYNNGYEEISKFGFVGLRNLGSTCYMNSIIQIFYNIKIFKFCILNFEDNIPVKFEKNEEFGSFDDNLFHQFQKLLLSLNFSNEKYYDPVHFCLSNKDYENNTVNLKEQQDAQEFLNIFFDKIENSLKNTPYINILKSCFEGSIACVMKCFNCSYERKKEENFYNLQLEVEHLDNLDQSFKKFNEEEKIEGFQCESCNKKCEISKTNYISKMPNFLILHLKRIVFDLFTFLKKKIKSYHEFKFTINIKDYCIDKSMEDEEYTYKLKGMTIHKGNENFGHYYSFINIKEIFENEDLWIEFNDKDISKFDMDNLNKECYGEDDQVYGNNDNNISTSAYLLVYEKIKKNKIIFDCLNDEDINFKLIQTTFNNQEYEFKEGKLLVDFFNFRLNINDKYKRIIKKNDEIKNYKNLMMNKNFIKLLSNININEISKLYINNKENIEIILNNYLVFYYKINAYLSFPGNLNEYTNNILKLYNKLNINSKILFFNEFFYKIPNENINILINSSDIFKKSFIKIYIEIIKLVIHNKKVKNNIYDYIKNIFEYIENTSNYKNYNYRSLKYIWKFIKKLIKYIPLLYEYFENNQGFIFFIKYYLNMRTKLNNFFSYRDITYEILKIIAFYLNNNKDLFFNLDNDAIVKFTRSIINENFLYKQINPMENLLIYYCNKNNNYENFLISNWIALLYNKDNYHYMKILTKILNNNKNNINRYNSIFGYPQIVFHINNMNNLNSIFIQKKSLDCKIFKYNNYSNKFKNYSLLNFIYNNKDNLNVIDNIIEYFFDMLLSSTDILTYVLKMPPNNLLESSYIDFIEKYLYSINNRLNKDKPRRLKNLLEKWTEIKKNTGEIIKNHSVQIIPNYLNSIYKPYMLGKINNYEEQIVYADIDFDIVLTYYFINYVEYETNGYFNSRIDNSLLNNGVLCEDLIMNNSIFHFMFGNCETNQNMNIHYFEFKEGYINLKINFVKKKNIKDIFILQFKTMNEKIINYHPIESEIKFEINDKISNYNLVDLYKINPNEEFGKLNFSLIKENNDKNEIIFSYKN